jgi:serine/threonine protein phosphatase PrpC
MGNLLGAPVVEKETHDGVTSDGNPFAVSSMQGWRVHMEDAHITEPRVYASELVTAAAADKAKSSFTQIYLPGHSIFAVFDGHGGTFAAMYSGRNFCRVLSRQPKFVEYAKWLQQHSTPSSDSKDEARSDEAARHGLELLKKALVCAFVDLDREIACALKGSKVDDADEPYHLKQSISSNDAMDTDGSGKAAGHSQLKSDDMEDEDDGGSPADSALKLLEEEGDSGTTACVVVLTPTHIVCANAGDSRAVLSRQQPQVAGVSSSDSNALDSYTANKPIPLSFDHKPEDPDEERRIRLAGGYVAGGRVEGDLAVSRGLGDFRFKNMDVVMAASSSLQDSSHQQAGDELYMKPGDQKVSPIPDVTIVARNAILDEFIIVACDGIWDVQTNYEAVHMVASIFNEGEAGLGLVCEEVSLYYRVRYVYALSSINLL